MHHHYYLHKYSLYSECKSIHISYLSSNGISNCVIAKWARWLYPQWYSWPSAVLRNGTHWIFALFIKICILCSNSNILVVNWRTLWMLERKEKFQFFSRFFSFLKKRIYVFFFTCYNIFVKKDLQIHFSCQNSNAEIKII